MNAIKFLILSLLAASVCPAIFAKGTVVTYPAPQGEAIQSGYGFALYANGKKLDLYRAQSPQFEGGEYYFASFDFEGEVEVRAVNLREPKFGTFKEAQLFPDRFNIISQTEREIIFSADKAFSVVLIHKEREMPIVIFGNPVEKNPPKKDDPNVIYFGPGTHVREVVRVASGQTLYLAGGAVLKSRIYAEGDNITVRGRGIISGELYPRVSARFMADFYNCKNLKIEGVIFKDPMFWALVTRDCEGVEMDNVKICASRMINDDAIDLCNTSKVRITNCFARAQDDIIAIKGMEGDKPCEDILIQDCLFWTDIANVFRIGYECKTPAMRNIVVRNIDIPFYSVNYRRPEAFWSNSLIWLQPAGKMPMHNIHFENINVRSDGSDMIVLMANPRVIKFNESTSAGELFDCSIKNLKIFGKKGKFKGILYFKGHDEDSAVKNIILENIEYFGEKIDSTYQYFKDEKTFTSGISIK